VVRGGDPDVVPAVGRGGPLVSTGAASRFLEAEKKEEQMSAFAEVVLLATDRSGESDRAARMAVELSRNLG
jgi:hypothetical protein